MAHKKNSNNNGHFRIGEVEEKNVDKQMARICILYLFLMLAFFTWQLFDTWIGRYSLLRRLGYEVEGHQTASFRLIAFTIIAGGLGGVVNGIRSTLYHYNGFSQRYAWKYISAPWMGATLALFVYALLRSSIAVLGGNVAAANIGSAQVLSNFAAGALAGYGSKDVFIWLDDKVHNIFKVPEKVPNVTGKPEEAAVSRLHAANLELGDVSRVPQKNGKRVGTVINQSPPPEAPIDRGESVDISVVSGGEAS